MYNLFLCILTKYTHLFYKKQMGVFYNYYIILKYDTLHCIHIALLRIFLKVF